MYNELAKYYDVLVKDDQATKMWVDFFNKHKHGKTVLELASGTGEITLALAKDYIVYASDLSESMLNVIKRKDVDNLVSSYSILDMVDFDTQKSYDNIICFCDSINYVLDLSDLEVMFKKAYTTLNKNGVFMFDMHTLDRLDEFSEDYIETGQILDTDYQWSIVKDEDYILQHFAFYEDDGIKQEHHIQRVYNPDTIIKLMEETGFKVQVFTDFNIEGISVGEKIFIVGSV